MANILKTGTQVRFQPKPIEGDVLEARIIAEKIQYRIQYTDWQGQQQERWFREDLLEEAGEE